MAVLLAILFLFGGPILLTLVICLASLADWFAQSKQINQACDQIELEKLKLEREKNNVRIQRANVDYSKQQLRLQQQQFRYEQRRWRDEKRDNQ